MRHLGKRHTGFHPGFGGERQLAFDGARILQLVADDDRGQLDQLLILGGGGHGGNGANAKGGTAHEGA